MDTGKVIFFTGKLTPALCRLHPEKVFVFGDNLKRRGKAGQACIRDEMNSYGLATKVAPSMDASAFFNDDVPEHVWSIYESIDDLWELLDAGRDVVIPTDDNGLTTLGTGMSRLPQKAPRVAQTLQAEIDTLAFWFRESGPVNQIDGKIA